jgi:hypothetical protein
MTIFKGTVKNNVVVLEGGACLPEGITVEVRVIDAATDREEAFKRILQNPLRQHIGWDEILTEEKEEREQRHCL